ncbi:hypothetical protein ACHAWF_013255, partial [Thalassiosira exigua]
PPTPPNKHWLLGHALDFRPLPGQHHDIIGLEWSRRLSSKVIMFELPLVGRFVSVYDADVARQVLAGARSFPKSPTYAAMIPLVGRRSLVVTEGKEWSAQRRLYNPAFSPDFLRGVVMTVLRKVDRFISKCDGDAGRGLPTNMLSRAIDLTSDVIAAVAFGEDWGARDEGSGEGAETQSRIRDLTEVVHRNMFNPLKKYFSPSHIWRMWRLSAAVDRDMMRLVKRRLEVVSSGAVGASGVAPPKDILSLTLSTLFRSGEKVDSRGGVKLERIDIENITSQLKTFYFAGHDTTATTIAWAYWLLVQHPDSLRKAREEVISRLGEDWAENATRGENLHTTTYETLQKCEFLDAVARETLRLYPAAATTRHIGDPNFSAGGYRLGGCKLHINVYGIQRDPDVWERPDEFVPERFLGKEGRERVASFSFLPFSKGPRDCIGKYFALLETKIALAALICRYDGTAVDANEVYTNRLTSIPMGGCKVQLRSRSAGIA